MAEACVSQKTIPPPPWKVVRLFFLKKMFTNILLEYLQIEQKV